jgi:hypothetical protein
MADNRKDKKKEPDSKFGSLVDVQDSVLKDNGRPNQSLGSYLSLDIDFKEAKRHHGRRSRQRNPSARESR